MHESTIHLKTSVRDQIIDITKKIQGIIDEERFNSGLCFIFVPHTTAAVTVNENADPTVREDFIAFMKRIIPWFNPDYGHVEGNTAAHVKSIFVGPDVTVPVISGKIQLGTWQGIFFCEFDGPRNRKVKIYLKQA
ncbi:MAG: secondary thiamine-phosphate synthase enzyme YjbQ [Candidatus Hodarchaeales archaeon]|jgi:secondary thiamine-phosphate synthase enzyme